MNGKMWFTIVLSTLTLGAAIANLPPPRVLRASSTDPKTLTDFYAGKLSGVALEFRPGDRIPIVFQSHGDFLESTDANPSFVVVKRSFFLEMSGGQVVMSLDGTTFHPFTELATGSFEIGATASPDDRNVGAIQLSLELDARK